MPEYGEPMRIGKITENALKRSVLKQIKTEFKNVKSAAVGSDCAFSEKMEVFSATAPLALDIGGADLGYYGVVNACNGLFSQGIQIDHVTVAVLLPEDTEEPLLKEIVKGAIEGAKASGTVYAGGHTEVTAAVRRPVVTATAVGYAAEGEFLADKKVSAGMDLVVVGHIALEGSAMLARERKDELSKRYPVPFIEEAENFRNCISIKDAAGAAIEKGASAIHDCSFGGIFAALWEMAERAGCGMHVDLKSIPIKQQTIEVCEFFEVNPYFLASQGALLCAAYDGEALVRALTECGIDARVIGQLQKGNDRLITNGDESRFLERPQADEVLRILG